MKKLLKKILPKHKPVCVETQAGDRHRFDSMSFFRRILIKLLRPLLPLFLCGIACSQSVEGTRVTNVVDVRITTAPFPVTQAVSGPMTNAEFRGQATAITSTDTLAVSAASLPLPSGAATSARQDTGNTTLSSIDGKITTVNTGNVSVTTGSISAFQAGAWTVSGPLTDAQLRASAVPVVGQPGQALAVVSTTTVVVKGAGAVVGESVAVRCVDSAGTGFESCAGSGGPGGAVTVSTGSVTSFQGGAWTANVNGSTLAVVNSNGGSLSVTVGAALPAGTNNIGDIDVLTLPSIPSGNNNIGDVDVLTLPALAAGSNNIGTVNGSTVAVVGTGGDPVRVQGPSGQAVAVVSTSAVTVNTHAVTQSGTWVLGANSGVDIGDVTLTAGTGNIGTVTGSTVVLQGSNGAGITATGNSINVNCTGGCGSATQQATFVFVATVTMTTNGLHVGFINRDASKVIKLMRLYAVPTTQSAVTGVQTKLELKRVTALTKGGTIFISSAAVDSADQGTLDPDVEISTGPTAITYVASSAVRVDGACVINPDETAASAAPQGYNDCVLYDFKNTGNKPLTMRQNTGFVVAQGPLASTVGTIAIIGEFTQE